MARRKKRAKIIWSDVLLHPADRRAAKGESLARARNSAWTENVCDDRTRVYQACAEGKGTCSRAGETGYDHSRVTQSGSPVITYDQVTKKWVYATEVHQVTRMSNLKHVAHIVRQGNNPHRGGNF